MDKQSLALLSVSLLVIATVAGASLALKPLVLPVSAYAESSTGLQLHVSISSYSIRRGQTITITISEYNPLPRSINLSEANNWPVKGLTLGPCTENSPMGIAVYEGNLSLSDISHSSPLALFQPGMYFCPMMMNYLYYDFPPGYSAYTLRQVLNATGIAVSGFWSSGFQITFPTGTYTVAAGDEWGAIALLHFVVIGPH